MAQTFLVLVRLYRGDAVRWDGLRRCGFWDSVCGDPLFLGDRVGPRLAVRSSSQHGLSASLDRMESPELAGLGHVDWSVLPDGLCCWSVGSIGWLGPQALESAFRPRKNRTAAGQSRGAISAALSHADSSRGPAR